MRRSQEGDATLSIRGFYNVVEAFFRATHKRFDYPNSAPHATQAWNNYISWIDALLAMTPEEAAEVEDRVIAFVLEELPSHEVDLTGLEPPSRRFSRLLDEFEFTAQKKEPRGAAFQGIVYAYIRADAPHLQIDISKSGAGSKRLQRVGDIDGWQGERLVLSAEVKHLDIKGTDLDEIANFANEVTRRNAVGLVVAESFDDEARLSLRDQGLRVIDRATLVDLVDIWDPLKQDAAVDAFVYYVHHIQQSMPLIERVKVFLDETEKPND